MTTPVKNYNSDGLAWTKGWAATPSDTVDETQGFRAIVAEDAGGDTKITLLDDTEITTYLIRGVPRTIAAKRIWITGSTPTSFTLWR